MLVVSDASPLNILMSDDILNASLAGHLAYKQTTKVTEATNGRQNDRDGKR